MELPGGCLGVTWGLPGGCLGVRRGKSLGTPSKFPVKSLRCIIRPRMKVSGESVCLEL